METPTTKICCYCGQELPVSEFYKDKHRKDGYTSRCKRCCSIKDTNPKYKEYEQLRLNGLKRCFCCKTIKPLNDFPKDRTNNDGFSYKCKQCHRKNVKAYRESHLEECVQRETIYRNKNRELILSRRRKQYAEYLRERSKDSVRERERKYSETLSDRYVKACLYQQGFSLSDITPELIAEKREQLKLGRAYRLLTKEINNQQNKE